MLELDNDKIKLPDTVANTLYNVTCGISIGSVGISICVGALFERVWSQH